MLAKGSDDNDDDEHTKAHQSTPDERRNPPVPPTHRSQLSLDDNLLCADGDENLRQAGPRFVRSKRCANPQPKAAGLCMEGSWANEGL